MVEHAGRAEIALTQKPMDGGIFAPMYGFKDDLAEAAIQFAGDVYGGFALGIEQLHGKYLLFIASTARSIGRQFLIARMPPLIVILLCRQKHKPAPVLHAFHICAGRIHPIAARAVQVNEAMESAGRQLSSSRRQVKRLFRTYSQRSIAAFATNRYGQQLIHRLLKPIRRRQQIEEVEHRRPRSPHAHQAGPAFAIGIAHPYAHQIVGRYAHSPGIAKTKTGARLPGNAAGRGKPLPLPPLIGPLQLLHGLKSPPNGTGTHHIRLRKTFIG